MHLLFWRVCFVFIIGFSLNAYSAIAPSPTTRSLLRQQLTADTDILAFGDIVPQYLTTSFVAEVIDSVNISLNWVAVELPQEEQGRIEDFVLGSTNILPVEGNSSEMILRRIRDINRSRLGEPLHVIAIGNSHSNFSIGEHYQKIDVEMYDALRTNPHFKGKGLLYTRMPHILKNPARGPQALGGGRAGLTLAMYLNLYSYKNVARIALSGDMMWSEKRTPVIAHYKDVIQSLNNLPPDNLTSANRISDVSDKAPFGLVENFDFVYRIGFKYGLKTQCQAILSQVFR